MDVAQLAAAIGTTPTTLYSTLLLLLLPLVYFHTLRKPEEVETCAPTIPPSNLSDYGSVLKGGWSTVDGTEEIPTRFAKEGIASEEGCPERTVVDLFEKAVKANPDDIALRVERLNDKGEPDRNGKAPPLTEGKAPPALPPSQWSTWSYREYHTETLNAAKAFLSLGHSHHDAVTIFGFNSPEWIIAEVATIVAGGKAAGVYPTDTVDQVAYKVNQSGSSVVCVDDGEKVDTILGLVKEKKLPKLRAVVAWAAEATTERMTAFEKAGVTFLTWNELIKRGEEMASKELDERRALIKPGHCCGLIYTSGTTGSPKAVMISHDNIIFDATSVFSCFPFFASKPEQERIISYLPLSHVAGLMIDIVTPLFATAERTGWVTVSFARPYDLRASSIGDRLRAVRPTLFLGVPRVWEKIAEKMKAIGKSTKGAKLVIAKWAKGKGLEHSRNMQLGGSGAYPFGYGLAEKLVLSKVKMALGLQDCKIGLTGAAPIATETLEYFGALGIKINELYGMSECSGATTISTDQCHIWGSCGFSVPGHNVKILDMTGKEVPRCANDFANVPEANQGEISYRGRHIMMGYMAQPALGPKHMEEITGKLSDAIDSDGWLHSGDKGCMAHNGFVKITGRYKELIIGAGGENIAPVPIEDSIKKLCPAISNVMMVGDQRKYNVALVTLKALGATGELPGCDLLQPDAVGMCGEGVSTISAAKSDATCIAAIEKAIKETNQDGDACPSNAAKVQKFTILPQDFSVATDELTPTLKLKRSVVEKMQADVIERMYQSKECYVKYD